MVSTTQTQLWRILLKIFVVALAYWGTAQLGFVFAIEGNVTAIWIPAGVALSAMLIFGYGAAPGILLGSMAGNVATYTAAVGLPLGTLAGILIGFGATLQAILGAYILQRFASNPRKPFERVPDVLLFVLGGALISCLVNGMIGPATVTLLGIATVESFPIILMTWWLGDATGVLVFAPLLLSWDGLPQVTQAQARDGLILLLVSAVVSYVALTTMYPIDYLLIPWIVAVVFRFGLAGTTLGIVIASAIAVAAVAIEMSAFNGPDLNVSFLLVLAFLGTLSTTALLLSAVLNERELAVRALERSNQSLDRRVQEQTSVLLEALAEVRHSRDQAEQANAAKTRFLAIMSHELRTPLNAIIGYVELTLMGVTGEINQRQEHNFERMLHNSLRLKKLIDDILDLSKIDAGRFHTQETDFNLLDWIEAVVVETADAVEKKDLEFVVELDSNLPTIVRGDSFRLRQVATNLIGNAIKFTPQGQVTLKVWVNEEDQWGFKVQDTGVGIARDQLENIFAPFVQLDDSSTREQEGTGLGLAISKRLVEMMDGSLTVTSELEKGSSFTVKLPIKASEEAIG